MTKRVVDRLQPAAKPVFIWDAELRGFGLRVEPTATKTFLLRYRLRNAGATGPKRFFTIGRYGPLSVEQARDQAKAVLGAVSLGKDPAADLKRSRDEHSFAAVTELFLSEHVRLKRKAGTYEDYASLLRLYALPSLGKRKITEVTRADLSRLHANLHDRPYRANRLLAVIGSLYSFAESRQIVPEQVNPARRIEKYREDRRERFLSSAELERLGQVLREGETVGIPWRLDTAKPLSKHLPRSQNRRTLLPPHVVGAIRLLMFTGARLREVLHLRWEQVDLERGLLLLPDSKTGRKTIVLNSAAHSILAGLPRTGEYVIPGKSPDKPRADLSKPWDAVSTAAGLVGVRLHDLRHTFASIGAGASLGLPIVGKLLGHSQPQTTQRYAHLDADPLRRASQMIGDHLVGALSGSKKVTNV